MDLCPFIGCFAEFVEVGDGGDGEGIGFKLLFGDFDDGGFEGLGMAFGVEELLAEVVEAVVGGNSVSVISRASIGAMTPGLWVWREWS